MTMAFRLSAFSLSTITHAEGLIFGGERFLPRWDEIPEKFRGKNIYTEYAEAHVDWKPTNYLGGTWVLRQAFRYRGAFSDLSDCEFAIVGMPKVSREHKVAAIAYLRSLVVQHYSDRQFAMLRWVLLVRNKLSPMKPAPMMPESRVAPADQGDAHGDHLSHDRRGALKSEDWAS